MPPVIAIVTKSRVLAPKAPEPVASQPSAAAVNVWSPVSSLPVSACQLPASPVPVQARKGVGQIRNLFQFAMLFEKSKEKSKIRTWYHKSFLSTSRLSEGGRRGRAGRRGDGKETLHVISQQMPRTSRQTKISQKLMELFFGTRWLVL